MSPSPKGRDIIKTANMLKCNYISTDSVEAFWTYSKETYSGTNGQTLVKKIIPTPENLGIT